MEDPVLEFWEQAAVVVPVLTLGNGASLFVSLSCANLLVTYSSCRVPSMT